jgi:hypothetical protein
MVISRFNFPTLPGRFQVRQKRAGTFQKHQFLQKNEAFLKIEAPTNWGTAAIMLPLVVFFKKISQKSYANDIHK